MPAVRQSVNPDGLLDRVRCACEALAHAADPWEGLFPSLLDRRTGEMLDTLPPPIPGQRHGDRAHRGSNLMHDHPTLATMYGLSDALGKTSLRNAADRYTARFATHCTDTASGLFPWGEHTFWNLDDDAPGYGPLNADPPRPRTEGIHDHLLQAPVWLWERLWNANELAVVRFAEGLANHWVDGEPPEYNRHARIDHVGPFKRPSDRSCDFPRHGGFFALDLAFAYSKTGRDDILQHLRRTVDYWWPYRDDTGCLLVTSRTGNRADWRENGTNAVAQTLSLGVSLLEAAETVVESQPELASTMRSHARIYADGFLSAPHGTARGVFLSMAERGATSGGTRLALWGSGYGDSGPVASNALIALAAFRLLDDARLLDWALAAGERYLTEPIPSDVAIPAKDAGVGVGLLAELYSRTGVGRWLDGALELGAKVADRYLDAGLPRGAASADGSRSIDYYESQHLPGYLLHALARTALLARGGANCPLGLDATLR